VRAHPPDVGRYGGPGLELGSWLGIRLRWQEALSLQRHQRIFELRQAQSSLTVRGGLLRVLMGTRLATSSAGH
jgi:hypothetical protein